MPRRPVWKLLAFALIMGLLTVSTGSGSSMSPTALAQEAATPEAAAPTGGVEIVLTAPDGSRLAGGCFAATDAVGATLGGCDNDGGGVTRIDGLAVGSATVAETTVPAGYTGAPAVAVEVVAGKFVGVGFTNALVVTPEPSPSPTAEPSPTESSARDTPASDENPSLAPPSTGQLVVTTVSETGSPLPYACFRVYTDAGGGARGASVASGCDQDDGQKDGRLLFDGLAAGSYVLAQTSAPGTSYTRATDFLFGIEAGQITTLTIQNLPGGFLQVATVDDGGHPLPGACYRAYLDAGGGTRGTYIGSGCDGSDADGSTMIRSLPFGDYVLGQVTPPSGFAVAPDQRFTITDMGGTWATVRQSRPGGLAVSTVDPDLHAPVPGACFNLYQDAGDGVRGKQMATGCDGDDGSTDGQRVFAGLAPGPYVLTEPSAPAGYAAAANRQVTIASDQITAVTIQNRPASGLTVATVGNRQQALAGACYKVYTDNGKGKRGTFVVSRCDTDDGAADGTTTVPALAPDPYLLVDYTPPTGYAAAADRPFAITAGQTTALTIQHLPGGEAAISLLDAADHRLPGACFTISPVTSGTVLAISSRCDKDDGANDGRTTIPGLAPGGYTLWETTVPSAAAAAPSQGLAIVAGQATPVVVKSAAGGSVFVSLLDETSQPLAGGCIRVERTSAPGQLIVLPNGVWAIGCDGDDHHLDGKIAMGGLWADNYVLKETKAPTGYLLDFMSQSFSLVGGKDARLTISHQVGGTVAIALVDEHQQPLPGACFDIAYVSGGGVPGAGVEGGDSFVCDKDDGANDGRTDFVGLRTGSYDLFQGLFSTPRGYLAVQQTVAVVAGQETAVTIQGQIAGTATVKVVDERNTPVLGACFAVYTDAGGGARGSSTGAVCDGNDGATDGTIVVDHLPSGSYVLAPANRVRWHLFPDRPFSVDAGHDTPITIQNPTGGEVVVTTTDPNGARIFGLCYDLYDYFYAYDDGGYYTFVARACDKDDGLDGITTFRSVPHSPDQYVLSQVNTPVGYWVAVSPSPFNLSPRQTVRYTVIDRPKSSG